MYETILRNEFKQCTSRELSDFELTALKDFIEYYGDDTWEASDLHSAIYDFLDQCYTRSADKFGGLEYSIRDWWEFPMAKKEFQGNRTIITYRGGTMVEQTTTTD